MTRDAEKRAALAQYLVKTAAQPFVVGKSDCAMWAAGAIQAMTGKDFARGFRGYKTLAGGYRKLRAAGFHSLADYAASVLEEVLWEGKPAPAFAQVCDLAFVSGDDGAVATGIVQGELIYVSAPHGRALVPLTSATRAFRV